MKLLLKWTKLSENQILLFLQWTIYPSANYFFNFSSNFSIKHNVVILSIHVYRLSLFLSILQVVLQLKNANFHSINQKFHMNINWIHHLLWNISFHRCTHVHVGLGNEGKVRWQNDTVIKTNHFKHLVHEIIYYI